MMENGAVAMLTRGLRWVLGISAFLLVLTAVFLWSLIPPSSKILADRLKPGMTFTEVDMMLVGAGFVRGWKDQDYAQWHQERAGYSYGVISVTFNASRGVKQVWVDQDDEPPLIDLMWSQFQNWFR
jgi:hypothetical protein